MNELALFASAVIHWKWTSPTVCRYRFPNFEQKPMNMIQARKILDGHKEGTYYNPRTVDVALQLLGDLQEAIERPDQDSQKTGLEGMDMARSQEA
jgi:hypothetical protein